MTKFIYIWIISITLLFLGIIPVYVIYSRTNICTTAKYYSRQLMAKFDILPTPFNKAPSGAGIGSDSYILHRQAAINSGLELIDDETELQENIINGILLKVDNGNGYKIGKLYYSKPYLTLEAYEVLVEIGREFRDNTNNDYFVVSSLTRTVQSQKKLSKNNVNATKNTSTHCYGCSFDISYSRFNGRRGHNAKLQSELESILKRYQQEGKIYVLAEKRTNCYHVTVR